MKKITEYRNIVFDMGGVLVDYTADNATWHFTDDPEIVREIRDILPGMYSEAAQEAADTEDCKINRNGVKLTSFTASCTGR